MIVIGLTGNIACGKSTVARMLVELGAAHLDADRVVHDLQRPGESVYQAIVAEFGTGILRPDGQIDRARLGQIVFADAGQLARLEALTHPAVTAAVEQWLATVIAPVAVVEAVKLVEAGLHRRVNSLWVVVCSPASQLARLQGRGLSATAAAARLASQPDLAAKLQIADVVIQNDGAIDSTRQQVLAGWRKLGRS